MITLRDFNPFKTRPLPHRNQSIDLLHKSMDWFLYDNGLRLERVKIDPVSLVNQTHFYFVILSMYFLFVLHFFRIKYRATVSNRYATHMGVVTPFVTKRYI